MRNEIFQGKFVGEERIYDMFTERVKDTLCLTGCHRRQTVYLDTTLQSGHRNGHTCIT